jgi:hypothetical protein
MSQENVEEVERILAEWAPHRLSNRVFAVLAHAKSHHAGP